MTGKSGRASLALLKLHNSKRRMQIPPSLKETIMVVQDETAMKCCGLRLLRRGALNLYHLITCKHRYSLYMDMSHS